MRNAKCQNLWKWGVLGPIFHTFHGCAGGMRATYKVPEAAKTLSYRNTQKNTAEISWKIVCTWNFLGEDHLKGHPVFDIQHLSVRVLQHKKTS